MTLPAINVFAGVANASAPFMSGMAFRRGDIPAGSQVVSNIGTFQCDIKSTWPDGSAKSAVVGGIITLGSTSLVPAQLSIGTPAGGAALTTGAIKSAAGTDVVVDCGSFGSVSWTGTDWDAPFETWTAGPQMANFRYRKPVGSDSHLVIWVEATVWANGKVRFLVWAENGYTKKAGVTNKAFTATLTIGGVQREQIALDIRHHQRPVLSTGSKTHHWAGSTDLSTMIRHDVDYIISTRVFPPYMASVRGPAFDSTNTFSSTSSSHRSLISTYQPGNVGNFTYDEDNMANTGYQCSIGLLPTHDAAYFICNTQFDLLYKAVVFNGYAIGRYSIFRRDENTNRPPSIVTHQTLVLKDSPNGENVTATGLSENGNTTPAVDPAGTGVTGWDVAHSPRSGLLAWLLTGEKFHLETTQAIFTTNWLSINSINNRAGVRARFTPDYGAVQTRQTAWGMNSLANATTLMPDSDPLKAEYLTEIEHHINYYHSTYAVGGDQFGIIEPGEEYGDVVAGHQAVSPWQQDFVTAAYGHLVAQDLAYPNSGTKAKLSAFFAWKAQTIIGRLNGYGGYTWENFAAFYRISIGTQTLPNYYPNKTGFLSSWAAVYAESASPNYAWTSTTPGLISSEYGDTLAAQGMVGNAQPGLAYAVEENVPGAAAAYARMTTASNWAANLASFKNSPVWAMEPVNIQSGSGGGTMPAGTPGPHAAFTNQPPRGAGRGVFGKRHTKGAPISDIPTGGTNGVSALRAIIENTDDPAIELRIHYTSKPTGFISDGLGGYTYSGSLPATVAYDIYRGGEAAPIGSATDTIVSSSGSTVSGVVVSPATATGSATFSAVVNGTGSPSQAVTWSRSGTAGSINASTGAWTAPSPTGSIQTITITATSTQDGTKSGTATVTIAATSGSTVAGVTVSPASIGVIVGASQQFAATVAGTLSPSQAVTWTVTGAASISTGGLATGPIGTYTVTARSVQDNTKAGTALFAVLAPGSASLPPDIGLNTLIVQGPVGIDPIIG